MTTIQIVSIPERENLLYNTISSLYKQADEMNIMLNRYDKTPEFVHDFGARAFHFDNSKGDAVKFFGLEFTEDYVFTCDDDLVYPPDYVEVMVAFLEKYDNKVIASCHGRIMNEKPVKNSYTDRKAAFRCRGTENYEGELDIAGTGVMAFRTDYFLPDYDRMTRNMADIWIAKFAHEQRCRMMHVPHKEGWINYQEPGETIWDYAYFHPEEQTKLYNSF